MRRIRSDSSGNAFIVPLILALVLVGSVVIVVMVGLQKPEIPVKGKLISYLAAEGFEPFSFCDITVTLQTTVPGEDGPHAQEAMYSGRLDGSCPVLVIGIDTTAYVQSGRLVRVSQP